MVVAVSEDDATTRIPKFVAATCPSVAVWWDSGHAVAERLTLGAMPTALLIGRDGRVVLRHEGFEKDDLAELRAAIERSLAEK